MPASALKVLFADPRVIDNQRAERWRLQAAVGLLQPQNSEETSSSLLELLVPLSSPDGRNVLPLPIASVLSAYFLRDGALEGWATEVSKAQPAPGFNPRALMREMAKRQKLLTALESYLMANRGGGSFDELKPKVRALAESTLAYALAQDALKPALVQLFELAAENVERFAPDPARQATFAKTLLGAVDAVAVEAWVEQRQKH